jgi:lysine 2,3-aminomutase
MEQGDPRRGDWRWQLANSTRGPGTDARRPPVRVTPYYRSLISAGDPADPIGLMAFPTAAEARDDPDLVDDPICEEAHSPMTGLIRRYPDRALLLVSGSCAVNCRHCTRRIMGRGRIAPVSGVELEPALAYIAADPAIRDVIVSGGDPLLLEDEALGDILSRIRLIPTVRIIRVATRAPATLPMRVTTELVSVLSARRPVFVNTQFNHPRELTAEALAAVGRLVDAGVPVNNQAVLLAGVNDSEEVMEELCMALIAARVRPYYLFMCDLAAGTGHFRVPLSRGMEIMGHLRGRLSGMAIPQLVVDLPGGLGKIPVGPNYVVESRPGRALLRAPDGTIVEYPDVG